LERAKGQQREQDQEHTGVEEAGGDEAGDRVTSPRATGRRKARRGSLIVWTSGPQCTPHMTTSSTARRYAGVPSTCPPAPAITRSIWASWAGWSVTSSAPTLCSIPADARVPDNATLTAGFDRTQAMASFGNVVSRRAATPLSWSATATFLGKFSGVNSACPK